MKIAVLSIFILLLVAGLAMLQMDANTENQGQVTENQVQVLRETEMLTTQGLGICQKVVNDIDDLDEPCGDSSKCYYLYTTIEWIGTGSQSQPYLVDIFGLRTAVPYDKCKGSSSDTDCVPEFIPGTLKVKQQPCATITEYKDSTCFTWHKGPYDVDVDDVEAVPGCDLGGGVPIGGTSS